MKWHVQYNQAMGAHNTSVWHSPCQYFQAVNYFTQEFMLAHWGRDKMAAIFQTTFSDAFSWMKRYEFRLKFHLSLFLRVQLKIFQHWFRKWLGAGQVTRHYLKLPWWPRLIFTGKTASYWYRDSYYKPGTVVRPSLVYNVNFYSGNTVFV